MLTLTCRSLKIRAQSLIDIPQEQPNCQPDLSAPELAPAPTTITDEAFSKLAQYSTLVSEACECSNDTCAPSWSGLPGRETLHHNRYHELFQQSPALRQQMQRTSYPTPNLKHGYDSNLAGSSVSGQPSITPEIQPVQATLSQRKQFSSVPLNPMTNQEFRVQETRSSPQVMPSPTFQQPIAPPTGVVQQGGQQRYRQIAQFTAPRSTHPVSNTTPEQVEQQVDVAPPSKHIKLFA